MTILVFIAVTLGILCGMFFCGGVPEHIDVAMDLGLCLLLFFVGIDIGRNKNIGRQIRRIGGVAIVIPFMVAVGSIVGSLIFGLIFKYSPKDAALIGAGFGWYSLSAVIIAPYSAELAAIAFLSNVTREMLSVIMIPVVAKFIGKTEAVAPSGASAMDTMLPFISKATDAETTIIAFVSGVLLSLAVPVVVPFIMGL